MRRALGFAFCSSIILAGCGSPSKGTDQPSNYTMSSPPPPVHVDSTLDFLRSGNGKACGAEDVRRTVEKTAFPDTRPVKTLANSGFYLFHATDVDGFAAAINITLGLETQSGADKAISSVKCDGTITISAPAYNMTAERTFDVSYEIRPSAEDPSSFVVSASTGPAKAAAQEMLDQIAQQTTQRISSQAARQSADAQAAQDQAAINAASHPSFNCSRVTSYVLNTICGNQALIDLDNQLAAAYRAASIKANQSGDTFSKMGLVSEQRAWIAKRQQCADPACITDQYKSRIDELTNGPRS